MRGVYNVKLPSESFQSLIIGVQDISCDEVILRYDFLISEKFVPVREILPSEVGTINRLGRSAIVDQFPSILCEYAAYIEKFTPVFQL